MRIQRARETGRAKRRGGKVAAACVAAAAAVCSIASAVGVIGTAAAAYGYPPLFRKTLPPPVDWGAKRAPLSSLRQRCRFTIWVPGQTPAGYHLRDSRIAWVVRDGAFPKLPSRQAICLTYADDSGRLLWVVEARHPGGRVDLHENLNQVLRDGCFLTSIPTGSQLTYGTRRGVDFVLVATGLSLTDLSHIATAA